MRTVNIKTLKNDNNNILFNGTELERGEQNNQRGAGGNLKITFRRG